jgi:DNA-directed RNA polymerase II subunit RPB1
MGDVALDKIKTIKEIRPLKGLVYDLTVEKTRNFMLLNTVTLRDTFHTAGVATKNNVTTGIPRLREILKVTKSPKASSLTIPMKAEFNETDERGRETAREIKQDLELTLLRHITNKVAIYWDPTDEESVIEEDREMLKFYKEMELQTGARTSEETADGNKYDPWLLRFELNREEMYNKNITMADVVFVIKSIYDTVKLVYSDYNAQSLVMRIRVEFDMEEDKTYEDYFSLLKKFENKMLNTCVIRGVPGIKGVTFRKDDQKVFLVDGKYEKKSQYILDTDGSNYVRVMNHPAVDANRLYTTNIHDVMDILGLEAVRAILLSEIMPIFSSEAVNYRHLGILCDYITRSGRLMSVDRYGINKNEIGPLGKMSFEETTKIVMDAARFGEVDPVNGVSANVMMGQPIRGGTAFSQIMLDDGMLIKLSKGLEVLKEEEDNESVASVEDTSGDAEAPCSTAQFRVNMVMPPTTRGLAAEDDVELIELPTS